VSDALRPLIVGAGPAGIRAAQALVDAGLRPIVVDEAASGGGQIYRQRLVPDERTPRDLYGSEAGKATALHETFARISDRIEYLPQALVWNVRDKAADVAVGGRTRRLDFSHLILATGATDRVLPFRGWTTPGVFTLGGAQIALKSQGCAIGEQVVFLGSGPLLYLVAWQYVKAGAQVAAVLDTAPFSAKLHLLRGLLSQPSVVMRGFRYAAELMAWGVPVRFGVEPDRIEGETQVEGIVWRARGQEHCLACDAVGYGFALRSETQVADLAGCRFVFDTRDHAWRPERDVAGRTSVPGVYIAGDGAGIAGADAAELAGERAGLALLEDAGRSVERARIAVLERRLAAIQRFRDVL
jgi:thioredoxin reductase